MKTFYDFPPEWLAELRAIQQHFPEAVIAGGALRDWMLDKPVRDLDIFVKQRGTETMPMLYAALGRQVFQLNTEEIAAYEDHFSDIFAVYNAGPCGLKPATLDDLDDLDAIAGFDLLSDTEVPVQVIALNMDVTPQTIVNRFDFGICKIASSGEGVYYHGDFQHDAINQCFTLRLFAADRREASLRRYARLQEKYSGWPLVIPAEGG